MRFLDVERGYEVVGLFRHLDERRFTVAVAREGEVDPIDTGLTVGEFVDPAQLRPGEVFGYFRPSEVAIFKRGLTKDGQDLDPETGEARAPDAPDGPLEDGDQVCRICRRRKAADEFSAHAMTKGGRRNYCRDCASDGRKA